MGRTIGAMVAGTVVWGILWNVGNLGFGAAFPDHYVVGRPITSIGMLVGMIGYSVVLSVIAGWVAAAIKGAPDAMVAVKGLAALNLLIGVVSEVSYWDMMPVWYHIVFLALVVPATLAGGRLKSGGATAA